MKLNPGQRLTARLKAVPGGSFPNCRLSEPSFHPGPALEMRSSPNTPETPNLGQEVRRCISYSRAYLSSLSDMLRPSLVQHRPSRCQFPPQTERPGGRREEPRKNRHRQGRKRKKQTNSRASHRRARRARTLPGSELMLAEMSAGGGCHGDGSRQFG